MSSHDNIFKPTTGDLSSENLDEIKGYDFNKGLDYEALLDAYRTTGFQATNFSKAINEINRMIKSKLEPLPEDKQDSSIKTNCTIFLGYTSNMISCGVREYIRYLVQHKMVNNY
jgi:deoxyhypusine synthase